jgi:hypothetical protein
MQAKRADIAARGQKGQSATRAARAALARVARAASIGAIAKPDAFRRGARSCYRLVISANEPIGASRVSPGPLNLLGNPLLVRCSKVLRLFFACLTGENTQPRFVDIQANPGFFGKPALCAVQQKVPERVSAGPTAGDSAGQSAGPKSPAPAHQAFDSTQYSGAKKFFKGPHVSSHLNRAQSSGAGPNTGSITEPVTGPITDPITGRITGLEQPVPPDQAFESVGVSGTRKNFEK